MSTSYASGQYSRLRISGNQIFLYRIKSKAKMTHKTSAFLTIKLYIYFILLTAWLCLPATGFAEKLQTGTEIGEIETNINGNS